MCNRTSIVILIRVSIIHSGSGAKLARATLDSKEMAIAEQMQEALQQLQVLEARIAALETQLQLESARAQTAEQERSAFIQTLGAMRTDRGGTWSIRRGSDSPSC